VLDIWYDENDRVRCLAMDSRWLKETPKGAMLAVDAEPREARRALRRAVEVPCDVVSHYSDEPQEHVASDVSPFGMWIDTVMPLHPGAEVVVGFRLPSHPGPELFLFATVTRVVTGRRRGDRGSLGMAIEFSDMSDEQRETVASCLQGIAPRFARERVLAS
jgi:hypothetical protein